MTVWLLAALLVAAESTPARPIPTEVTICVGRAERRCWTAAGRDACDDGEVFAVVASDSEPGVKLRACWDQFQQ